MCNHTPFPFLEGRWGHGQPDARLGSRYSAHACFALGRHLRLIGIVRWRDVRFLEMLCMNSKGRSLPLNILHSVPGVPMHSVVFGNLNQALMFILVTMQQTLYHTPRLETVSTAKGWCLIRHSLALCVAHGTGKLTGI